MTGFTHVTVAGEGDGHRVLGVDFGLQIRARTADREKLGWSPGCEQEIAAYAEGCQGETVVERVLEELRLPWRFVPDCELCSSSRYVRSS